MNIKKDRRPPVLLTVIGNGRATRTLPFYLYE